MPEYLETVVEWLEKFPFNDSLVMEVGIADANGEPKDGQFINLSSGYFVQQRSITIDRPCVGLTDEQYGRAAKAFAGVGADKVVDLGAVDENGEPFVLMGWQFSEPDPETAAILAQKLARFIFEPDDGDQIYCHPFEAFVETE